MKSRTAKILNALLLASLLTATLGIQPAYAASIVVNSSLDTVADVGNCTLREAIIAANTNTASGGLPGECPAGSATTTDVITLTSGVTYSLIINSTNEDASLDGDLDIIDNAGVALDLQIVVSGATNATVAQNATTDDRVFDVLAGARVEMTNLTITGGSITGNGGGIRNSGTLTITNSTISNNSTTAGSGGGILNDGTLTLTDITLSTNSANVSGGGIFNSGTVTLIGSTLSNNSANQQGGGIRNTGTVTINSSTLSNNSAAIGGGISSTSGTVTITNSTLSNNATTTGSGGGIINAVGANVILTGSTLSGNSAANTGGGIINGGTITITNSTLSGNTAAVDGGGILNNGTATLTASTLSGNQASTNGGGIANNGTLTLTDSTLSTNTAALNGGGISNNAGTLTLTNSTLSANVAASNGGGIFNSNFGTLTLTNSTLSGNSANGNGGGINNSDGAVSVTASTFSNNNANSGGGIYSFAGTNTIENSTFSGNGATVGGSAITAGTTACAGGNFSIDFTTIAAGTGGSAAVQIEPVICGPSATLTMSNTIVSRNGETQPFDISGAGSFTDAGNNITNDATGTPAGVTVNAALGLGPLSNNGGPTQTHALLAGSPAIDAGNNTSCPSTDQRGVARPINTTCDIGAYEAQVVVPTPTPTLPVPVSVALPNTGFAPNHLTSLSAQPDSLAYTALGDIWLEIPALNVRTSIVGIPKSNNKWNVDWLGKDAGWLNGTAFPSWEGNSVLTGHVYDANGLPGPFANLKDLKYGDQIIVHLYGEKYIFEIREVRTVQPISTRYALKHLEKYSYLTLITCQFYDEKTDAYLYRRIVRAVLVKVQAE